jgi:amino acid transporter
VSDARHAADKYRRDMGLLGAGFVVVNSVVGAGIFALPELLHQAVGTFAPWLVLGGAAMMATVVICFAALTRLTDRSGGPQRFVTDAFGRFPGFQIGWLFYFGRMVAHAANITVLIAYAAALWPGVGEGALRTSSIILVIALITILNVFGIRRVVAVLGGITLFKLLPLLVLILVAIAAMPSIGPVQLPQFSAVEGVALAALYAFTGFENATIAAGEAQNAKRTMPRALLACLAAVTLIYFGLQFAYTYSPVAGSGSTAPLASLAGHYGGDVGSLLIAATAVVSVLGNAIAGHVTASRMTASLADDTLIPHWFGAISRWGTPANSILFFGAGALAFALTGTFVTLAVAGTLARLILYLSSIMALPVLRKAAGLDALTPGLALAAGIAVVLCLWATFQSKPEQWAMIGAFLVAGTLLFVLAQWPQVRHRRA